MCDVSVVTRFGFVVKFNTNKPPMTSVLRQAVGLQAPALSVCQDTHEEAPKKITRVRTMTNVQEHQLSPQSSCEREHFTVPDQWANRYYRNHGGSNRNCGKKPKNKKFWRNLQEIAH